MLISHRLARMIFRTCSNLATALAEKYFSLSASHYWISPICRATSSCSFSYTYRVTVSPSTLSRGSSIRAEARLPEISICAGVVTVCLIWHGAAYVRNKSSRVQCRCPHRKPIVYADLTRMVYSSRFRTISHFRTKARFASYLFISSQIARSETCVSMREEKHYSFLFNSSL